MGLDNLKLTDADIAAKGIVAAPDRLVGDAATNKKLFDRLVRESVMVVYNGLIDALTADTGADEIGARLDGIAGSTVQAVLTAMKVLVDAKAQSADVEAALGLKAESSVTDNHFKAVSFDHETGKFTFTKQSGATVEIDTALEKVAVNWRYDADAQALVLELADGSSQNISLSEFVSINEFIDSGTVEFSVSGSKVTASIVPGSISDSMLSSALVSMLQGHVSAAAKSTADAAASEKNAKASADAAAQSAAAAEASRTGAGQNAADAKASADSAAKSESDAADSKAAAEAAAQRAEEAANAGGVPAHNADPEAHADIRQAASSAASAASTAQSTANEAKSAAAAAQSTANSALNEVGKKATVSFSDAAPNPEELTDGEVRLVTTADGDVIEVLEHIEGTGTQYVDTGFYPNQDTKIVVDIQLTSTATQHILGARTATTADLLFVACTAATTIRVDYGTAKNTHTVPSVLDRVTIELGKEGSKVGATTQTFAAATFSPDSPIGLFAAITGGAASVDTYKAHMKLYSCQIYDGDTLVRDYVPSKKDGVAGLYDKVNGIFKSSATSTAFVSGPSTGEYVGGTGEAYFKLNRVLFKVGGGSDNSAAFGTRGPVIIRETQILDMTKYGLKVGDSVNVICIGGGGGGAGRSTTYPGGAGGCCGANAGGNGGGAGGGYGAGGGGAGGADNSTSSNVGRGGGGGGSGYLAAKTIVLTSTSIAVTVGAAGTGGTSNSKSNAGSGGTTSFGNMLSADGGGGGGTAGDTTIITSGKGARNGGKGGGYGTYKENYGGGGGGGAGGWLVEGFTVYSATDGEDGETGASSSGGLSNGYYGGKGGKGGSDGYTSGKNNPLGGAGAVIFWY